MNVNYNNIEIDFLEAKKIGAKYIISEHKLSSSSLDQIKEDFIKGNTSLSRFWEQEGNAVLVLPHRNYNVLKSYDLPEDEAAFRTR